MFANAENGYNFLLTFKGFMRSREKGIKERRIGEPVKGFEKKVPISWIAKGYVIKAKEGLNTMCIDCKKYSESCEGTTCQTLNGCIYKERKEC